MPRAVPALHRARVRERHDRAVAGVAESAPDAPRGSARSTTSWTSPTTRCCSPASRCTHSTSTAWRARGWWCAARARASRSRRSTGRRARSTSEMVLIEDARRADLDRGRDGRRALGGGAGDDARADGGRQLGRAPTSTARSWTLGLRSEASSALREGAAAGAVHARAGDRRAADDRAVRRARSCPGTIDIGATPPPPAHDPPARAARARDPRRGGRARAPGARSSRALDFDERAAPTTAST